MKTGFVCPPSVKDYWRVSALVLLTEKAGDYCLVDMDIQTTVFVGTQQACYDFLLPLTTRHDRDAIFGLDVVDLAREAGELSELAADWKVNQ
jgi:hypothetical protein